jgi:hypothetical protein
MVVLLRIMALLTPPLFSRRKMTPKRWVRTDWWNITNVKFEVVVYYKLFIYIIVSVSLSPHSLLNNLPPPCFGLTAEHYWIAYYGVVFDDIIHFLLIVVFAAQYFIQTAKWDNGSNFKHTQTSKMIMVGILRHRSGKTVDNHYSSFTARTLWIFYVFSKPIILLISVPFVSLMDPWQR